MSVARDAQAKVAAQAEELASEVEIDLTVPRAAERGMTVPAAQELIRFRYARVIEALGRV